MVSFEDIAKFFGSNIKALEVVSVLRDAKPAARMMIAEEKIAEAIGFLGNCGLSCTTSDFKVKKHDGAAESSSYSDAGITIPSDSAEKGYFFLYAAKEKEKSEHVKLLENSGRHKELGIALGYPECCAAFYKEHSPQNGNVSPDLTLEVLKRSQGFQFPFEMNIAARHFDVSLISHFPCSFHCTSSLEIAKNNFRLLSSQDPEIAEGFKSSLKTAAIYTDTQGVFLLKGPILEGNRLSYTGIKGTQENQLCAMLKSSDFITIHNNNRIALYGFEMKNVGVMLFQ